MRKENDKLRVLPCTDSTVHAHRFHPLKEASGIELLSLALAPLLFLRAQRDRPGVIVIAAERFRGAAWSSESQLREILAAVPAVLLTPNPESSRRRAERLSVYSVLPWQVSGTQLVAAVFAAEAGLAVSLPATEEHGYFEPPGHPESMGDVDAQSDLEALVSADLPDRLTSREVGVLRLMALGLGNKQIASRLEISEHTAKFHVSQVLAKLGASSRTEAVSLGITHGLVDI